MGKSEHRFVAEASGESGARKSLIATWRTWPRSALGRRSHRLLARDTGSVCRYVLDRFVRNNAADGLCIPSGDRRRRRRRRRRPLGRPSGGWRQPTVARKNGTGVAAIIALSVHCQAARHADDLTGYEARLVAQQKSCDADNVVRFTKTP